MQYYGYGDPLLTRILVVVACVSVVILVLLFVVIMPPGQIASNLTPVQKPVLINTSDTALSPENLMSAYTLYSTSSTETYTGKLAYIDALVGNVEPGTNGYESCVELNSIGQYLVYGCNQAGSAGWIIWNWGNQVPISQIPIGTNFVAKCIIGGMSGGNLVFNNCTAS